METREPIINALKKNGLKVTPQRIAIMELLAQSKDHPSAEIIRQELARTFPSLSLATIYNTLEMLVTHKLVLKLKISEDSSVNYDFNTSPHHHLYCRSCGRVIDIHLSCDVAKRGEVDGHSIEEVHGYFKGQCASCRTKN